VDDLWGQVADSDAAPSSDGSARVDRQTLEHQQACPHCRAMLAELREVWAPVAALAAQPVPTPDSLSRGVMERVSALASHGWHAIVEDDPGQTRIAAWVVAVVARRAATSVLGVATVRGRVLPTDPAIASVQARYVARPTATQQRLAAGVGVAGRKVVIRVEITATGVPPSLPILAEQVRRAVIEHVRALTGLRVVEVDVHVSDIGVRPPAEGEAAQDEDAATQ
ncbi:MAG: Asp23/Gls24 family envelope stress response protein, partial [Geodermatophilaceae bacterium]|nr:Asp23/Gls24 family envelope stress response protein [Geodermatophilaceae bacterium]